MTDRASSDRKPAVVYIDVDDVLVRWEGPHRMGAPGAAKFLRWLLAGAEVRWLTAWCPGGTMRQDRLATLADLIGLPVDELRPIRNPLGFPPTIRYPYKAAAVDFDDVRPWAWIEDARLHRKNIDELRRRGLADRLIACDTSRDPDDLARVRCLLEARGFPYLRFD